ncbi:cytochrome c-type biogenesis protein [Caulobacter segnis]
MPDPAQEARARDLFKEVRCLVCQNEVDRRFRRPSWLATCGGSSASRSRPGAAIAEIRAFLVQRYGEFVLLKPAFSAGNAVLWLAPVGVLLVGGGLMVGLLRRRETETTELSQDEEERVRRLLEDD